MAGVTVTMDGLSAVLENINITEKQLSRKIDAAIQGAGIACEGLAKQACPVDTGRLRASIAYQKVADYSCTVGTNVKYATFIEFGTRHMKAQPFLYPSYAQVKRQLLDELRAV